MSLTFNARKLFGIVTATCALSVSAPALAVDAAAAEALARKEGCFKCHAVDKKKDGEAYRVIAGKYKGKSNATDRLYTHITTGEKAKFPDGHEEDHKIIKTKDKAEIKNLIEWILSL